MLINSHQEKSLSHLTSISTRWLGPPSINAKFLKSQHSQICIIATVAKCQISNIIFFIYKICATVAKQYFIYQPNIVMHGAQTDICTYTHSYPTNARIARIFMYTQEQSYNACNAKQNSIAATILCMELFANQTICNVSKALHRFF